MSDDSNTYLGDLIETVVWKVLSGVHTCFPAKITAVKPARINPQSTVVDVVAVMGELNPETGAPDKVEILNIPLVYPGRTGKFIIRPPVDSASLIGACVKISVSDTFIADWKKQGGTNLIITDKRRFDRRDAIAEFGFYPDSMPWPTPAKDGTAQMKVGAGTFLEIGNSSTDIPRLIADMMNIISTAASNPGTSGGPLILLPSSISGKTLAQLVTEFATLFNPDATP
jgi:hypothetical protein